MVHPLRPLAWLRRCMGGFGVTSTAWAAKRTPTSPSSQRISSFVVRSVMRAGSPGVGLAFVVMQLRELLWIRSGSLAALRVVLGMFMETKSRHWGLEAPARPISAAASRCTAWKGSA